MLQRIETVLMQPAGKWIPAWSAMPRPESATVVRGWTCLDTFSGHRCIGCLLLFRVVVFLFGFLYPFVSCVCVKLCCVVQARALRAAQ